MNEPTSERPPASRPKLTIGRLMIAVAVVAALLSVLQAGVEMQCLAGALIVGGCTVILAYKLTVDSIAHDRSAGLAITPWQTIWTGLASLVTALFIIGSADCFFLFVYFMVEATINHPYYSRYRIGPGGLIVALVLTVLAVSLMRRLIWGGSRVEARPRPTDDSPDRVDPIEWLE
jgi:hypothetical protein